MRLLLISNSTNAGEAYLDYPKFHIRDFLGSSRLNCLFLPYAGVTISFDDYEARVKERFAEIGHELSSIHHETDPVAAIKQAEAIVVGGGNTFQLIKMIQENGLIGPVKEKVQAGIPYVGWSAGSNVSCPSIKTTNDMPILEPDSFQAFNLVPFQINPHYTDLNPPGHAGETREDRIMEYLAANTGDTVLGLREGCMLRVEDNQMSLTGNRSVRIFRFNQTPVELDHTYDFSEFLN
ncbi:MAG: dipeptidase PepE [Bacteroidales bacterium]|nr:dipeptidase PepE [Bacteroidales bacterium]